MMGAYQSWRRSAVSNEHVFADPLFLLGGGLTFNPSIACRCSSLRASTALHDSSMAATPVTARAATYKAVPMLKRRMTERHADRTRGWGFDGMYDWLLCQTCTRRENGLFQASATKARGEKKEKAGSMGAKQQLTDIASCQSIRCLSTWHARSWSPEILLTA